MPPNSIRVRFSDGTTKPVVGHKPDPQNAGEMIPLVPKGRRAVPATSFGMSYEYLNEDQDGSGKQLLFE